MVGVVATTYYEKPTRELGERLAHNLGVAAVWQHRGEEPVVETVNLPNNLKEQEGASRVGNLARNLVKVK